jgi:hypothetical protein
MSTTPVLSAKATELFVAGFGQTNLEMFLAADVAELFHEHVIEEDDAQKQAIAQVPVEATIADVVALLEGIASAEAPVADAPAPEPAAPEAPVAPAVVESPVVPQESATPEAVIEVAQNVTETTGVAPEAPAVIQQAAPANLAATPAVLDVAATPLQPDWVAELSPTAQVLKHAFDTYVTKMRPRAPVTADDIASNQATLARTLSTIINGLSGNDFHLMFNYVLQQFVQHADATFRPALVNRGMDVVALAPEALRLFQRLINMFSLLGDPATREVAHRQIDLSKTLAGPISEPGRQRVFQFFGL